MPVRPLRLDGHALEGAPPEHRRLKYTPVSIALHAVVLTAFLLGPLLGDLPSPEPALGLRAFFTEPGILAPPPPPPPPPQAPRAAAQPKAPVPSANMNAFVAPVEIPDQIARPSLSFAEGGVAGGVEGGVEGGVAGGIVGGLPAEIAPLAKPPTPVIRVGGEIRAPKRTVYVAPEYPALASQANVAGMVILEARVGTDGRVREATVLRGQPLFDEPARAAVMQWRYQPLLLNGVAMEFVLTVTVQFSLRPPS
jgi:protein TonB